MTERYSFLDDYSEGCHPRILELMTQSNLVQQTAYGDDEYSISARRLIQEQIQGESQALDQSGAHGEAHTQTDHSLQDTSEIPVFFVAGGTLANIITMASALRSHEAVIASHIGHIVVRETGAIEATGHKIITVPTSDGKLTPAQIQSTLASNAHFPHMARPRLVYISNATEVGTVYTKTEVQALSKLCKANNLLLMMDGARLGTALAAPKSDLTLKDVARLTDIFWIGGTKAGALIGEAIVIPNPQLAIDFAFHIKQRGALLAKGRLLGIQFQTLFTDDLFMTVSASANLAAQTLSAAFVEAGHPLSAETESNQIFPVLPNTIIDELKKSFDFYVWEPVDENSSVIRLVTSWATDETQVQAFIAALHAAS